MKIDLYTDTGAKKGEISLNEKIFGAKINKDLMHRALVMRLANDRTPVAHTLTRAEVARTTKKAFKQKGTGRARRGALSTSLIRGGGVAHGPRNDRNFSKSMPKKERRLALFSSLSVQARDHHIFALEYFSPDKPKTKKFVALLKKLPEAKYYLFVIPSKSENFEKSVANIPHVHVVLAPYLHPTDVLKATQICFLKEAFPILEKTFLSSSK